MSVTPFWVAGKPRTGSIVHEVHSPFDGTLVGSHAEPSAADVDEAVQAAVDVQSAALATTAAQRADALMHVSQQITARAEEIAQLITAENGKPLMWSRIEVTRGASTFRWAAEEARRWSGELQRLDTDATSAGRMAVIRRFPNGPVLGIAPFNFPLNLVAHKVAPALAVGAPIIVKPAPATPMTALLLGELLAETDLPAGMWSVLPLANEQTADLVADPRLPVVSFTGSETVGYHIQASQPTKHVVLELGGNAAAVVLADWSSDADLEWAATRIATFGNYQAGQSCVSVQRVLVDESVYERFVPLLVAKLEALKTGAPTDEDVQVGPVINDAAAARIQSWIDDAVASGATLLAGGTREGTTIAPTLLSDAPAEAKVSCEEVFGPVLSVLRWGDEAAMQEAVNGLALGLTASIWTRDLVTAHRAAARVEAGYVWVNDCSSHFIGAPFGGYKQSGLGREESKEELYEFTQIKNVNVSMQ